MYSYICLELGSHYKHYSLLSYITFTYVGVGREREWVMGWKVGRKSGTARGRDEMGGK